MKMTDMLSSPNCCFTVFPKRLSTNFSTNTFLSLYFSLISFMYSIIFWLLFTNRYHIPSHPITMYESSFVLSYSTMSGTEITGCSLYFFVVIDLYSKSPNARERFTSPLIRPFFMYAPAELIRFSSSGF